MQCWDDKKGRRKGDTGKLSRNERILREQYEM